MTHEQIVIDLPALLRGELDRARLAEVVQHLETCDECRLELVAATQGHSAVTAAVRTLRPETGPATGPATAPRAILAFTVPRGTSSSREISRWVRSPK